MLVVPISFHAVYICTCVLLGPVTVLVFDGFCMFETGHGFPQFIVNEHIHAIFVHIGGFGNLEMRVL